MCVSKLFFNISSKHTPYVPLPFILRRVSGHHLCNVTNYLFCRNSVQQYFFKGSCRLTQAFEIALRNRATVFTARTEESAEQQYLISSHLCGKKVRLRRQTMSSNRLTENGKCDFGGVSHWPPANLRSLTHLNTLQLHFFLWDYNRSSKLNSHNYITLTKRIT